MHQFISDCVRPVGLVLAAVLGLCELQAGAQGLPLNFLFRPNAWIGYEHLGPAKMEEGRVELPSAYVGLTIPVHTSIALEREPLKVKAHQIMAQFYSRYQQVAFSGGVDSVHEDGILARRVSSNLVASAGFVGIKASLNQGVWVYGFRTNMAFGRGAYGSPNVSVLAGLARAQMKGLHRGYLYGAGFFASQDIVVPIPAFGYYYKPYKEVTFYFLFPVQMRLSYQATEHFNMALVSTISTRPGVVKINTPEETRLGRFSSIGLRHGLLATLEPRKHTRIFLEAGFMVPQQIAIADRQNITFFAKPTWFADITFMRSFGPHHLDSPLGQF